MQTNKKISGFQKQKIGFLSRKDKSIKGSIDGKIKKLVGCINSLKDYYTTSSCSGRIILLATTEPRKKNLCEIEFCSHRKVNLKGINKEMDNLIRIKKIKQDVWIKAEPAILHISSETVESAIKLLNAARDSGFKRSGIIGVRRDKVSVEIAGTERLEAIIIKKGELIIGDLYLSHLIKESNLKLEITHKKIIQLANNLKPWILKVI